MPVNVFNDCPSDVLAKLVQEYNKLRNDVNDLITKYNAAVTLINELKADLSAHTHTENTAETYTQNATTGAAPTISAANATAATITADIIQR